MVVELSKNLCYSFQPGLISFGGGYIGDAPPLNLFNWATSILLGHLKQASY